jgi:hypothetical protein
MAPRGSTLARLLTAGVTALLVGTMVGCSSGPDATTVGDKKVPSVAQSDSSSATPSPAVSTDPDAIDIGTYMKAVASEDPDTQRKAVKGVAAGSPAAVYLMHQANVAEAILDGGDQDPDQTSSPKGGGYDLCAADGSCIQFTKFEKDAAGRLVSFAVNDNPVADLVSQGNGKSVRAGGAQFTFLTAYKSQASNALFVVLKVRTGANKLDLNIFSATYRDPSGKQREAGSAGGPAELAADSNALTFSAFVGVKPGGVMTLTGCVAGCNSTYTVKIKTR